VYRAKPVLRAQYLAAWYSTLEMPKIPKTPKDAKRCKSHHRDGISNITISATHEMISNTKKPKMDGIQKLKLAAYR
jgi:hypothetical protein